MAQRPLTHRDDQFEMIINEAIGSAEKVEVNLEGYIDGLTTMRDAIEVALTAAEEDLESRT